jgi:hypothetical protein
MKPAWVRDIAVLRLAPAASSPVARQIRPGTPITIQSADDGWYFVEAHDQLGGMGWIIVSNVSFEPLNQQWLLQKEQELKVQQVFNAEKADWEHATQIDSIEAYIQYLDKYMPGDHGRCTAEAIDRVETLLWPLVEGVNTFENYVIYLELFPDGAYAPTARARVQTMALIHHQIQRAAFWAPLLPFRGDDLSTRRDVVLSLREAGRLPGCTFGVGTS